MDNEFYDFENNDFVLIIKEGPVVSIETKTNGTNIEILDNNIKKCIIAGTNYDINDDVLLKIKEHINDNINELVHCSMLETSEFLKENILFGGGESLYIKIGLLNFSIACSVNGDIKAFYNSFVSNIKNIIMK